MADGDGYAEVEKDSWVIPAIAREHGGSIMAQSRDGGGAVFTFELPMEEDAQ